MQENNISNTFAKLEECLFFVRNQYRRRAYICSPLRADTAPGIYKNMYKAREYMLYTAKTMKYTPYAPHAYIPMLLNDIFPEERALALEFGLRLLELCNALFVCGGYISDGMKGEIAHAAKKGLKILVFNAHVLDEVRQVVSDAGGDVQSVRLNDSHPYLGSSVSRTKSEKVSGHSWGG